MYDPEYNYCPSCKDEYRPDIEKCAGCGVLLLSGSEMNSRSGSAKEHADGNLNELQPDDDLVVVRSGPNAEIKGYMSVLAESGFAALLASDESSCGKGCCGGNLDLLVRREDAAGAIRIIEDEISRTAIIDIDHDVQEESCFDPLAKNNTCPACGHSFSGGVVCPDCGLCF